MTKQEIIEIVAQRTGQKKNPTRAIVECLIDVFIDALTAEGRVEVRDFGIFNVWSAKDDGGDEMKINFECKGCKKEFDCDVGNISVNEKTMRPDFEKPIICPDCRERSIDDVLLTELGQSQMTEATWDL